jgi:ASC-1-like (ASCH) protein/superfamily II DNA or RNA helicase
MDTSIDPQHIGLKKNSTSYPIKVNTKLKALYDEYLKYSKSDSVDQESLIAKGLKYYQYLVRGIMTNPEYGLGQRDNPRGLLIYHKMGVGKTFLAVSAAIGLMDKYKPVVILAKSLQKNFSNTIEKYVKILRPNLVDEELTKLQKDIINRFNFVSLDAYNMHDQVSKVAVNDLSNKLLIVDEAHNLFRGIINSSNDSTNARKLYNMVMATKNMRILFLTGTPAAKSPFELVACFNMLMGYEILPAQYEIFHRSYVYDNMGDIANMGYIKNKDKLSNRLVGMVSFVPTGESDTGNNDPSTQFPEEYPTIIENVEMSTDQYRQYLLARDKESGEKGSTFKGSDRVVKSKPMSLPSASSEKGSTYFVKSRTISNFTKAYDNAFDINDMNNYNCNNSEKMCRIVENIKKSPGIAIVYSQFVNAGGLKTLAKYLEKEGYTAYNPPITRVGSSEIIKEIIKPVARTDNIANFHLYSSIMGVAARKGIKYVSFMDSSLWHNIIKKDNENKTYQYKNNSTNEYNKYEHLKVSDILQPSPMGGSNVAIMSAIDFDPDAPTWYNFMSQNVPELVDLNNKSVIGFEIDERNILHISNAADIDNFDKEYVMCPDNMSDKERILCDYYGYVNWKKVSEKYHGLIIDPFIAKDIKFRIWYSIFDASTVLIWNNAAIKHVYILYTPLSGINTDISGGDSAVSDVSDAPNKKYAIISGEIDTLDRENIQKVLNSPENMDGELISVLLISKTGAEGLDLKGVRQVHIMEPYWDKAREDQVKSRGVRLGSHSHLPPDKRNVQPYLYISVANKQIFDGISDKKRIETETIDEQFHQKAVINYKINTAFRTLLQEVSIECAFNNYKNCKVCMPDDQPLYTNSFIQDLHLPNPCKNVEEQEVDVKEIKFRDVTYYYQKSDESYTGFEFFEYNKKIDAYTPISKSTPLFLELSEYMINMDTRKSLDTIAAIIGQSESDESHGPESRESESHESESHESESHESESHESESVEPKYTIHVSEPWFGYIKSGEKTIEGRKNKGDFKKMEIGDIVKWIRGDDSTLTKIIGKRSYSTFKEYLEAEGLDKCLPGIKTIEDGVAIYYKYYTPKDEAEYGALAIEIERI